MAFDAMVRNFNDLVEECVLRMLRVTRKGIRLQSLSEYALLRREDGSPAWGHPATFDTLSETGFWHGGLYLLSIPSWEMGTLLML